MREDFDILIPQLEGGWSAADQPFDALIIWSQDALSLEGQEQLVSLLIELHGDLVDDLAPTMCADESLNFRIDGRQSLDDFSRLMRKQYYWTDAIDFGQTNAVARVWYVSEEKLEPRLGERHDEPLEPYEQPLCPGRDAARMMKDLERWEGEPTLGAFLLRHPEHRHIARRAQVVSQFSYAEVRDNTIAHDMLPIDLLRCKLSFFGATKFDPRSDRWVRITMYQGAPYPDELVHADPDDLAYPSLEGAD